MGRHPVTREPGPAPLTTASSPGRIQRRILWLCQAATTNRAVGGERQVVGWFRLQAVPATPGASVRRRCRGRRRRRLCPSRSRTCVPFYPADAVVLPVEHIGPAVGANARSIGQKHRSRDQAVAVERRPVAGPGANRARGAGRSQGAPHRTAPSAAGRSRAPVAATGENLGHAFSRPRPMTPSDDQPVGAAVTRGWRAPAALAKKP